GSVVVGECDITGIACNLKGVRSGRNRCMRPPFETNPVLCVDPNAVLPVSIATQCFEPVRWRGTKIAQDDGRLKFVRRLRGGIGERLELIHTLAGQEPFCLPVFASTDRSARLHQAYGIWYIPH